MASLLYNSTPTIAWKDNSLPVRILVKLECENHPQVSGNKWWKLKYNLQAAMNSKLPVLTFGGAYSNHIFAVAAACHALGLRSIGVIRGERVINQTLEFASQCGMKLEFVSRETYSNKASDRFVDSLREKFGDFFLIPEGGTNELAIRGCHEWGEMLIKEINFDTLCIAVGTGGTIAGLISAMKEKKHVVGFSSLKGGTFLEEEVKKWLPDRTCRWEIDTSYHFGGYAKKDSALINFIEEAQRDQGIILDPVYTAKMMYGVVERARRGSFRAGSTVLAIHTGGLQGRSCHAT